MEQVAPILRDDPENAFIMYADLCDQFITQGVSGQPYDSGNLPEKEKDFNLLIDIIIGLAVGVIIALIIVLVQKPGSRR